MPLIVQYEHENCKNANERIIKPIKINKTRRRAFNEYYEVNWRKLNSKDGSDQDLSELIEYVTLERFEIIEANFPNLIKEYQDMIEAKKSFRSNFTNLKISIF